MSGWLNRLRTGVQGLEQSAQDLYEVLATPNETMLEVYVAAVPAFAHAEY
jgi:hypothetical protein